jgi:hypothetical protein
LSLSSSIMNMVRSMKLQNVIRGLVQFNRFLCFYLSVTKR